MIAMTDPSAQGMPPEPLPPPLANRGRPVLATLIGALVLLLPLGAPPGGHAPYDLPGRLGALTGFALVALIVWGLCYAITIKRAVAGWKIASLVILILVGLLVGVIRIGQQSIARDDDETMVLSAQLKALAAKDPASATFEAGADAGPITRLTAAMAEPILADARRLAAAQKAAGLDQLLSLEGVTQSSPMLDHCDQVAALAPMTSANVARFPVYLAAVRKEGDAIVAAGQASRGNVDSFIRGLTASQEKFVRQGTLATRIAEGGAELCRILARRNWTRGPDGRINFTNNDDLAAAQAVQTQLEPVLAEFNANRQAGIDQLDQMPR